MAKEQNFKGFDFGTNPYEQEARERWGDAAVDQSKAKLGSMTKEEMAGLQDAMNAVYRKLADLRHGSPESDEAQAAVQEWYDLLNGMGNHYTLEAFKGLGQLYVDDERFTKNIDRFGEGLAAFLRDAMAVYADNNA